MAFHHQNVTFSLSLSQPDVWFQFSSSPPVFTTTLPTGHYDIATQPHSQALLTKPGNETNCHRLLGLAFFSLFESHSV